MEFSDVFLGWTIFGDGDNDDLVGGGCVVIMYVWWSRKKSVVFRLVFSAHIYNECVYSLDTHGRTDIITNDDRSHHLKYSDHDHHEQVYRLKTKYFFCSKVFPCFFSNDSLA